MSNESQANWKGRMAANHVTVNDVSLAYTVTAEFDDVGVADEYVAWLEHGHLQAVVDGGAERATLIRFSPKHLEVRYRFASQASFSAYEQGPAVALRAEGAERFPPSRGVRLRRSVGTVLATVASRR